jgi:hypothetical protein
MSALVPAEASPLWGWERIPRQPPTGCLLELAASVIGVKGSRQKGSRLGAWLTLEQAQALLQAPAGDGLRAIRDRSLLALLIGCGLRRAELAALEVNHIALREGRWVIVDLLGKGSRLRSVPMPGWAKTARSTFGSRRPALPVGGSSAPSPSREGSKKASPLRPSTSLSATTPHCSVSPSPLMICGGHLRGLPITVKPPSNRSSSPLATTPSSLPNATSVPARIYRTPPAIGSASKSTASDARRPLCLDR